MDKILLFCPTYEVDDKLHFWPDSQRSFQQLRAPKGVSVTRLIGQDNPYPAGKDVLRNTLHQYQQAQQKALEGGFDALCTFEDDMIVPADGLIKLWDTPGEVIYGLYMLRHGAFVVNAFRRMDRSPNIGESLSFYDTDYDAAMEAGTVTVSGCGMGFTLFRRSVLEKIPFRDWEGSWAPDWALAYDCQRAKIPQMARFDVKCGHIEDDGRVLWPGKYARKNMKVKVLVNFVGEIGNGNQVFHQGEVLEADPEMGWEYVRAGFMSLVEVPPITQTEKIEFATAPAGEISRPPRGKSPAVTPAGAPGAAPRARSVKKYNR